MRLTKLMFTLAAAMLLAVLLASPALAREGGYWRASYWTGTQNYAGGSPHAGYTDTSSKCKVCHAAHGAGLNVDNLSTAPATEDLLRTTAADACTFCHITNNFTGTVQYNGNKNVYTDMSTGPTVLVGTRMTGTGVLYSGHSDGHHGAPYEGCVSCHSVHGADIVTGSKILKDDPAKGVTSEVATSLNGGEAGWGAFTKPVTNQRDFCLDCHNGVLRTTSLGTFTMDNQAEFTAVYTTCGESEGPGAYCHSSISSDPNTSGVAGTGNITTATNDGAGNVQFGVAAQNTRSSRSHVMTTELHTGDGTQIAWHETALGAETALKGGNSCTTCHDASEDFPHYSTYQSLINSIGFTSGTNSSTGAAIAPLQGDKYIDAVCAKCHTDSGVFGTAGSDGKGNGYTAGPGRTF